MSLSDRNADLLLRAAIESIGAADGATARSFPVRDAEGSATLVAHVVPIRLSARDIFVRCAGVLALTPLSAPNAPSVAIVKSLFDLTPAEARVARDLAEGKTVADIASGAGARRARFGPTCAPFWKRPAAIDRPMWSRCSPVFRRLA